MTESSTTPAQGTPTGSSAEALEKSRRQNWKKFWKVMALMPLWFVMPFTAFFKMQEVLTGDGSKPKDEVETSESETPSTP